MIPSPNMIMRDWQEKELSKRQRVWYALRRRRMLRACLWALALSLPFWALAIWVSCR